MPHRNFQISVIVSIRECYDFRRTIEIIMTIRDATKTDYEISDCELLNC